jgi:lipopolysaccharide biosynthesis glycosyltransferase
MDQIYINCDERNIYSLDVTRLTGSKEMVSRRDPLDKDGVRKQVERISNTLKSNKQDKIILLDDVIFSGSVIDYISNLFNEYGINVVGASAAISSNEAYNRFNYLDEKIKCEYLMSDNVLDEICERDFFYGIPQSGMVKEVNGIAFKAPYFLPFGDPVARASCPDDKKELFSQGLIKISIKLWEEINRLSKREIMNYELPEQILNTNLNESVVKTLKKELK